ncbi:MAG: hypothetical protein WDA00_06395 [Eubacteriales bacterium]
MTIAEWLSAVALLGLESTLEEVDPKASEQVYSCLNRALYAVNRLRPRTASLTLHHYPPRNLLCGQGVGGGLPRGSGLSGNHLTHFGGIDRTVSAAGAVAYTFSVSGSGSCRVSDGGESFEHHWTSPEHPKRFCGPLSGGTVSLVFSGAYSYHVSELALWDSLSSPDRDKIPRGTYYTDYHLPTLAPDFLTLAAPPEPEPGAGWTLEAHQTLRLPNHAPGSYEVRYHCRCPRFTADDPEDTPLPLDEDLCELLPLLTASYLYIEDAPERAADCRRQYQEQYALLRAAERDRRPVSWVSQNGW